MNISAARCKIYLASNDLVVIHERHWFKARPSYLVDLCEKVFFAPTKTVSV